MADETGAETTEETPEQTEGSRLRQERDAAVKQAKQYREDALRVRIEGLGLNPDAEMGLAIRRTYKGDDVTEAALKEFAQTEYKMSFEEAVPTEVVTEPAQRIEGVTTASTPVEPPPAVDAVAAAEAPLHSPEGATREQAQASVAAKMTRYRELRRTGQIVPD